MHARFAPVRDCFHDLFSAGRETGAALTIWYDGRPVVDLIGGSRSAVPVGAVVPAVGADDPWRPDTLVNVYSVGKPVVALCLLTLVDRGLVDLDAAVSAYWPGFRAPATVRQVLSHTAGLPAFPVPRPAEAVADWHATAPALARLYAGLLAGGTLDGVRLFSPELVAEATRVQYAGPDLVLDRPAYWTLGMGWEPDGSWGMGGIGGSSAWADPERGYTFAYATARLADHDRVEDLVAALHACL